MSTFVSRKYSAAFSILLGSLSVSFSDADVDSMVAERARAESQSMPGSLQCLCSGSSAFGGIVSSYFSGSLVDARGVRKLKVCFCVTALLPLITSAVAVLVKEQCVLGSTSGVSLALASPGFQERSKHHMIQLWNAVKQPRGMEATLFATLVSISNGGSVLGGLIGAGLAQFVGGKS